MMKLFAPKRLGLAVLLIVGCAGLGTSNAEAQGFGLSYNSPGLSIGINQPAYYGGGFAGGYYPAAPVIVPRPVVVAPPVVYGPRPFYAGGYYGPRGPYPHPGGYYGGPHGGPGYGYGGRRY